MTTALLGQAFRIAFAAIVVIALAPARGSAAENVLVFAAASLKNALDDATAAYRRQGGDTVRISYAASSALVRQLENGAPADIFISADGDWMDYAQRHGLIESDSRKDLLGNRLVLIAPASTGSEADIQPGFPLAKWLGDGRLAMADPDSVPAGKYGKAALEHLGVWASVEGKLVRAENVRSALFFVARNEAPLGIVYATDAAADSAVRIVGVFPESSHPPIVYPIALTAASKSPAAAAFLEFLESAAARRFFEAQGFRVLN